MTLEELFAFLRENGYRQLRVMPNGKIVGLQRQLFTTGLFVGLTKWSYERRYCYEHWQDASNALLLWDGTGDPSGPWIKEKPSERLGPGATEEARKFERSRDLYDVARETCFEHGMPWTDPRTGETHQPPEKKP